jgi:hypothetical protein
MKDRSINYSIARFSIIEEAISGVTSAITNFIKRIHAEQTEANRQMTKRRQALCEYHQEIVDGMSLEEWIKTGIYRFSTPQPDQVLTNIDWPDTDFDSKQSSYGSDNQPFSGGYNEAFIVQYWTSYHLR